MPPDARYATIRAGGRLGLPPHRARPRPRRDLHPRSSSRHIVHHPTRARNSSCIGAWCPPPSQEGNEKAPLATTDKRGPLGEGVETSATRLISLFWLSLQQLSLFDMFELLYHFATSKTFRRPEKPCQTTFLVLFRIFTSLIMTPNPAISIIEIPNRSSYLRKSKTKHPSSQALSKEFMSCGAETRPPES